MAIGSQTQQLFSRVFGRPAESAEEQSFLKDASARKSGGALQGALEFAKGQGRFGGGGGAPQGGAPSQGQASSIDDMVGNLDKAKEMLNKKAKQLDEQEKKFFSEKLKMEVKSTIMSMPEIKALQKAKGQMSREFQEKDDWGPSDSPFLRPGVVDDLRRGEMGAYSQSLSDLTETLRTTGQGVGNVLDAAAKDRMSEIEAERASFDRSRNVFADALSYEDNSREAQLFPLQMESQRASIASSQAATAKSIFDLKSAQNALLEGGDSEFTTYVAGMSPADILAYSKAHNTDSNPKAVLEHMQKGGAPKTAAQYEALSAVSKAYGFADELGKVSALVNTEEKKFSQIKNKTTAWLQGTDPEIARLQGLQLTATLIARSLGEKGVISDGDIKRIQKSIPDWNDSKAQAEAKIKVLKDVLDIAAGTTPGSVQNSYNSEDVLKESTSEFLE